MMSYVIRTDNNRVVVIDGGYAGDGPYLKDFLAGLGNRVDAWFITHPHDDHIDALGWLLRQGSDLQIGKIYGSLPAESWVAKYEPASVKTLQGFNAALRKSGRNLTELEPGRLITIDGVYFRVLGTSNPDITANAVNNSSVVIKVSDRKKSVLFTGDLGVEGGEKLLGSRLCEYLKSDYVQMAHHGQNGVSEVFYHAVRPDYCLWPAPRWLWDNDNGGGKGSGPWKTLEVRRWMQKLNVRRHYVSADGLQRID